MGSSLGAGTQVDSCRAGHTNGNKIYLPLLITSHFRHFISLHIFRPIYPQLVVWHHGPQSIFNYINPSHQCSKLAVVSDLGQHAKTPAFVYYLIGKATDPCTLPCRWCAHMAAAPHCSLGCGTVRNTYTCTSSPAELAPAASPGLPSPGEVDSSKGCNYLVVLNSFFSLRPVCFGRPHN